jgi:hypothetical protein
MNAPTARAPIVLLLAGLVLVALAYVLALAGGSASAPWALALGATLVLTAMLWLGGRRRGRLPRALAAACVIAALATFGGFSYALLAPAPEAGGALLFGVPRTATILLLLIGAVPMLALPLLYAAAFDDE